MLVKQGLPFKHLEIVDYKFGCLEALSIQIQSSQNSKIDVLNIYYPNQNWTQWELEHHLNQLGSTQFIADDFNAHTPLISDRGNYLNKTGKIIE